MRGIDHIDSAKFFEMVNDNRTRGHSLKLERQWGRLQLMHLQWGVLITGMHYLRKQSQLLALISSSLHLKGTGRTIQQNTIPETNTIHEGQIISNCFTSLPPSNPSKVSKGIFYSLWYDTLNGVLNKCFKYFCCVVPLMCNSKKRSPFLGKTYTTPRSKKHILFMHFLTRVRCQSCGEWPPPPPPPRPVLVFHPGSASGYQIMSR